jgi:hypothetical protein
MSPLVLASVKKAPEHSDREIAMFRQWTPCGARGVALRYPHETQLLPEG